MRWKMAFRIDIEDPEFPFTDVSLQNQSDSPKASFAIAACKQPWLCNLDMSEGFLRSLARAALAMADQIHVDHSKALEPKALG